jgi:hypothetical protein
MTTIGNSYSSLKNHSLKTSPASKAAPIPTLPETLTKHGYYLGDGADSVKYQFSPKSTSKKPNKI